MTQFILKVEQGKPAFGNEDRLLKYRNWLKDREICSGPGGRGEVQINGVNLSNEEAGKLGFLTSVKKTSDKYIEEWNKEFAKWYQYQMIEEEGTDFVAEWWLSKFQSYSNILIAEVEKMQSGRGGGNAESYDTGFEKAKEDIINLIKSNV